MHEFNLGETEADFRVPDGGLHRARPRGIGFATAALVVEIVSPGDETREKLPFYAARDVDEVLVVDPDTHQVHWLALIDGAYQPIERSSLFDLSSTELEQRIDWP